MSVASVGGQFFMGLALSHGVPGSVVYMLGMGASMCVVVLGGVLFFHERVGVYAKLESPSDLWPPCCWAFRLRLTRFASDVPHHQTS